jgi:hypothetical protein
VDISLNGAEIALITVLLGSVTTPLTLLFRMLMQEKDRQIQRLEAQNEKLIDLSLTGTRAVESATTVLKTTRGTR